MQNDKMKMSEKKFWEVQRMKATGVSSSYIASELDITLTEANKAYCSSTYEGYLKYKHGRFT